MATVARKAKAPAWKCGALTDVSDWSVRLRLPGFVLDLRTIW
jgi:hypothetical protein